MMKEKEPRFSLTLDEETRRALDYYTDVTGESKASVVRGILRSMAPALMKTALVIERGRELEGTAKAGLVEAMEQLEKQLDATEQQANDLLESL